MRDVKILIKKPNMTKHRNL